MNISFDKLAPPVIFTIVGFLMMIFGGTGTVPIGNPHLILTEGYVKITMAVIGMLLLITSPLLVWREIYLSHLTQGSSATLFRRKRKYYIKIVSPVTGKTYKGGVGMIRVEVSGTYKRKPPPGFLRLFVETTDPASYWVHPIVVEFDENGRIWHGAIELWKGDDYGPYSAMIVAAVLDKTGEETARYQRKIHKETKKNIPLDNFPAYIELSEKVLVYRF